MPERRSGVSGGGGQRRQASESHQVVGGGHQITGEVDALQPAVARLAEATHRLHPAEDLFNPFAHLLTSAIAGPTGRATVNGAAPASRVLRDVRRDALSSQ